jgi:hypothetical protein
MDYERIVFPSGEVWATWDHRKRCAYASMLMADALARQELGNGFSDRVRRCLRVMNDVNDLATVPQDVS